MESVQVMEIVTKDLSQHTSVETLAAMFGISPTSVKNYFRGVYGKNISAYLRCGNPGCLPPRLRSGMEISRLRKSPRLSDMKMPANFLRRLRVSSGNPRWNTGVKAGEEK